MSASDRIEDMPPDEFLGAFEATVRSFPESQGAAALRREMRRRLSLAVALQRAFREAFPEPRPRRVRAVR
jgi:hypothetical protein